MYQTDMCVSLKHFFKDDELDTFKSAMSAVEQYNDPTNAHFNFVINYTPTGDVERDCKAGKGSKVIIYHVSGLIIQAQKHQILLKLIAETFLRSYATTDDTIPEDDNGRKFI